MVPSQFLKTLWGERPPGLVHVWSLPDEMTKWYAKFDGVDDYASKNTEKDLYTGVGLTAPGARISPKERVRSNNVYGIAGLWADLDIADPVHKATNLPPTLTAAQELLEQALFAPTLLVNSGHGLQAWWLFQKPWVFQTPEERLQAQALTQWWHQEISRPFREQGWSVDAVHDLARAMRLPGTINNRGKEPVQAQVMESRGPRHDRQEFLEQVPEDFKARTPAKTTAPNQGAGRLVMNPDGPPPIEKIEVMTENDLKFRRSWQKNGRTWQTKHLLDTTCRSHP